MERELINRADWEKSIKEEKVRMGLQRERRRRRVEEEEKRKNIPTNSKKLKGKGGAECKIFHCETVNSYKHTITYRAHDIGVLPLMSIC